ncbi:MAG: portal protein [Candidatus Levybacteria bacterium]|nr:portal protein [Candidatus Levybacteria bacterium]
MKLFGYDIKKIPNGVINTSFAPPISDDGGVNIAVGGFSSSYIDIEGAAKTESDLVTRYRDMAIQPEIETAVDEITNEAISVDEDTGKIVELNMDNLEIPDKLKISIKTEFEKCLELLNFNHKGYEIFRQWYIDGRLFYHAIVDQKNLSAGIIEMRNLDPRNIRKVREIKTINSDNLQQDVNSIGVVPKQIVTEFFIYSNKNQTGKDFDLQYSLKISRDAIVHCTSGLTDKSNQIVLSYLHKAIRPLNQLRSVEDAALIYRLARAPERRIFYIDIGNLPKIKAEQHVRDMMTKHKNKLVYDASTGEVKDQRKFTTMLEDYWIPRREGGKGTQIETLPGASNLGEISDITYFKESLYNSLNIPSARLNSDTPFVIGQAETISKDEVKFYKMIHRMRNRFQGLFLGFLEKQLILKKIVSYDDWKYLKERLRFTFTVDNYFAELKQSQIMKERLNLASIAEIYVTKYFDENYIRKVILKQTEEEIEQMDANFSADMERETQRQIAKAQRDIMISEMQAMSQLKMQAAQSKLMPPEDVDAPDLAKPKTQTNK